MALGTSPSPMRWGPFPTQAPLRPPCGLPLVPRHHLFCRRGASGSEMQLLPRCCREGFVSAAPARSAAFLIAQTNPRCALCLCAFLDCVGEAFSVLSWTSSLSDTSPLWASVCVGGRVWASDGGQQPAANGTYCCIIAGARLSGSLPAV